MCESVYIVATLQKCVIDTYDWYKLVETMKFLVLKSYRRFSRNSFGKEGYLNRSPSLNVMQYYVVNYWN